MDGMEIGEALAFSLFMLCFFAVLMFSEERIISLGIRLIRKMAEGLPEKDREQWINEQCRGWIEERNRVCDLGPTHIIAASTAINSASQRERQETEKMTIAEARDLANRAGNTLKSPDELMDAIEKLSLAVVMLADEVEQLKAKRAGS